MSGRHERRARFSGELRTWGFRPGQNNAPGTNASGIQQFSTVDVNDSRLTSCAGNFDDGFGSNGALITVGGASPAASAG